MNYVKCRWKQALFGVFLLAAYHVYFFFFIQNEKIGYLMYLDTLVFMPVLVFILWDFWKFQKRDREKKRLMAQKELLCRVLPGFENQDLAEHDVGVLEEQLNQRFQENCDLQDYVAKWCHELKIPLAAALLMSERIEDGELKLAIKEQMERMNQQIHAMLLGCKIQGPLFDIQIKKVWLLECVKTSIHNNQFFLIQKGFHLLVEVGERSVYTDSAWLVYVLDQILGNAVKYGGAKTQDGVQKEPWLRIWEEEEHETVKLFVEDHGEGIREKDLPRIFDKGFTGSNYHNGKYKSTGMGLYMVSKIADRLGIKIQVESEYERFTRVCILFQKNPYFFR